MKTIEVDIETGEVKERSLTSEEVAQRKRDAEESAERRAEQDAQRDALAERIKGFGSHPDEDKALIVELAEKVLGGGRP